MKRHLGNKVKQHAHTSLQAATEHVVSKTKTGWQAAFTRRNYKDRRIRKTCEKGGGKREIVRII